MTSSALRRGSTPEQYLADERKAVERHQYLDGEVFAMSGASRAHNLVSINLAAALNPQLRDQPCEVYSHDMRVLVDRTGLYTYPDVVVVCGEPNFLDDHLDTLLNPTVLIEVLSPSTESYDRGRKFGHYRQVPSLREYVLVAQDQMAVDHLVRRGEDWVIEPPLADPVDVLRLDSIGCTITLGEIYAKVAFPEADSPIPDGLRR